MYEVYVKWVSQLAVEKADNTIAYSTAFSAFERLKMPIYCISNLLSSMTVVELFSFFLSLLGAVTSHYTAFHHTASARTEL